jgi:hypothetical protein
MKTFLEIREHSSYKSLPSRVQQLLRIAFEDPDHDLLKALVAVNPKAEGVSRDLQLFSLRKVFTSPSMVTLMAWIIFGIDLSEMEGSTALPGGQTELL